MLVSRFSLSENTGIIGNNPFVYCDSCTLMCSCVSHSHGDLFSACSAAAAPGDQWNYLHLPVGQVAAVQVSSAEQGGGDH